MQAKRSKSKKDHQLVIDFLPETFNFNFSLYNDIMKVAIMSIFKPLVT